jgi:ribonuclease E
VRVERRVIPVASDEERRHEVFERELWRIAVEHLDWSEQHMWAALAGARVAPNGWRRARAMLQFDATGELKGRFLSTAVERNKNSQLRVRALQEIAAARDADAFDYAIDVIGTWSREERREGVKVALQALTERRIGRRDQANAWIWRLAEYTRDVHEEYAVQRWPETKRLLGLLVNSSGAAHARNARRLVHAARKHDRRLSAALLAAAVAHTPEAEEVLRGARTRMARKPSALSRELLRNFPKGGKRGRSRRRRTKKGNGASGGAEVLVEATQSQSQPQSQARNGTHAEAKVAVAPPQPPPSAEEAVDAIGAALQSLLAAKTGAPGASGEPAPPKKKPAARRRRKVVVDPDDDSDPPYVDPAEPEQSAA